MYAGTGGRTLEQKYVIDNVRQKFTGKERDAETGLDYFLARYYSAKQGRFTSPDEFAGGPDEFYEFGAQAADNPTFYAELTNPQTLNKYQYCYNNPLTYVDPDGHQSTMDHIKQFGRNAIELSGGIVQGAASTVTLGAVGAPSENDTALSRIGQMIGTVMIGKAGTGAALGGGGASLTGGGALVGVPAIAVGTYAAAGASANLIRMAGLPIKGQSNTGQNNTGQIGSQEPQPVSKKEAVRQAHKEVGKQTERGTGRKGSPMRGNTRKGYRLDPPNPRGKGLEKTHRHVNWWDYTKGKRKSPEGRKGYIPIK